MSDSVNMSLDEIIKKNQQNRASRSRGRGGGSVRGRGGGRGAGRGGRGRGGRGRGRGGQSQSRPGTPGVRQGRSRSRGPRGRSQSRQRSGSRSRSRQRRSNSRARSASRSQTRRLTPKGRAGLEFQESIMPQLVRTGGFGRGRYQNRFRGRNNGTPGSVHSRLGVTTRRGAVNLRRPLAVAKRGISKRGRGLATNNRYSAVGLRSDQILKEQRQNMLLRNNIIKSQTFTRSRNNSLNSSQLTVSVANDFVRKRRNSVGNAGYLNRQSLAQFNNLFGELNKRRGPGSVKSVGSNKSNRSSRSNRSISTRSRGRGRGLGRKFVNKQMLNIKLQKEIAAIQGKTYGTNTNEAPSGVSFTPTPAATGQTLHQRFATT